MIWPLALALLDDAAPSARSYACPPVNQGRRLRTVTIFDGPVANNAALAPDTTRSVHGGYAQRWTIEGIYGAGRRITLRREYNDRSPLFVSVRQPVRECRARRNGVQLTAQCS